MVPLTAFNVTAPPVTSVTESPPSVIAPVRPVSVTAFAPALSPVTSIEPPTIVTLSLNVDALTSTAPVPFAASPIVIRLKPFVKLPSVVLLKSSPPVGPPMLMARLTVCGATTSVPLPVTAAAAENVSDTMLIPPFAVRAELIVVLSVAICTMPLPRFVAAVLNTVESVPLPPVTVRLTLPGEPPCNVTKSLPPRTSNRMPVTLVFGTVTLAVPLVAEPVIDEASRISPPVSVMVYVPPE